MFHWKRAVVVATVAALALTGCSAGGDSGTETATTLTLGTIVTPNSLSAQNAGWANQSPYSQAVYDALLKVDVDGNLEPYLATEWEYNEDNTVLTLTLRDDVTFTDGSAFNADVAAQNLIRFRDGTSPNASFLVNLADAVAVDDTHVQLTLSAPDPAMLVYLTQAPGQMESAEAFDNADVETNPIGSGPYILNVDETVVGSSWVFDKNPDYWDPENQHFDKVVMNYFSEGTALLNAIQGGQVDGTPVLDVTTIDQIEGAGYTATAFDNNWWGFIIGDRAGTVTPAIADVRVRQALNYAIDRDVMLGALANGLGTVTQQVFPTSSTSFSEELDQRYSYDPEKARELLAEAGYADGFDLTMPSAAAFGPSNFPIIQQQLADVGIRVTFEDLPTNDYINALIAGKYSVALMALQLDPTDWQLSQFELDKSSTWNGFHTDDPIVQGYIATLQSGTAAEAEEAGALLNEYIVEQGWFAPWFRPDNFFATSPAVTATPQVGNSYPYLWNIVPNE